MLLLLLLRLRLRRLLLSLDLFWPGHVSLAFWNQEACTKPCGTSTVFELEFFWQRRVERSREPGALFRVDNMKGHEGFSGCLAPLAE